MIVIGSAGKMATLNGMMIREGSTIGDMVVKRIEPDRVLIKTIELDEAGNTREYTKWIYLEERP